MTHPPLRYSALIADEIPSGEPAGSDDAHRELVSSIRLQGLLEPLVVRQGNTATARGGRQPPARGEYHPRGHAPGRPSPHVQAVIDEGASPRT